MPEGLVELVGRQVEDEFELVHKGPVRFQRGVLFGDLADVRRNTRGGRGLFFQGRRVLGDLEEQRGGRREGLLGVLVESGEPGEFGVLHDGQRGGGELLRRERRVG